jgi:NAD+ diphosphatase
VPRPPNVFAGPYLDRIAHLRKDDAWVRDTLGRGDARIVPVCDSRNLVQREASGCAAVYLTSTHPLADGAITGEVVLLGRYESTTYYALEIARPELVLTSFEGRPVRFEDLRVAGGQLDAHQAGILAYARAMLHWRGRHRHCGVCGSPTRSSSAGHVMKCTSERCGADHFPRLDPAIIVLVTDGERALLGRQASWPEGRYSTIAGFVEPGESLEDAVAREVFEETGIRVREADYHSSQPWPFPSSLMIGYTAVAEPGQAPQADEELEDARWFTRADIASGFPGLPPPQSVSYRLIEDWYDRDSSVPLRETAGVSLWGSDRRST